MTLPFWVVLIWVNVQQPHVAMSLECCFGLGHPEITELFKLFKLAKTIHTHYDQNLRLMNYAHYVIKHGNGKIHR